MGSLRFSRRSGSLRLQPHVGACHFAAMSCHLEIGFCCPSNRLVPGYSRRHNVDDQSGRTSLCCGAAVCCQRYERVRLARDQADDSLRKKAINIPYASAYA